MIISSQNSYLQWLMHTYHNVLSRKQARKLNMKPQYQPSRLFSHKEQKTLMKTNCSSKIMKHEPIAFQNIDPEVTKIKLPMYLSITSILQNLKMQGRHVIHTQLNY